MPLDSVLKEYLASHGIRYALSRIEEERAPHARLARGRLLLDKHGPILALLAQDRVLDLCKLERLLGRKLTDAPAALVATLFPGCDPEHLPPVGSPYGVLTVGDEALYGAEEICFHPGRAGTLLCMSGADFRRLQAKSRWGRFVQPPAPAPEPRVPNGLRERVERLRRLPPMPQTANRLLWLRAQSEPDIAELAAIVARDPSLAAQVIRYARSPFFGFRGQVESIEGAISNVLGFDMALNLALGVATCRNLTVPASGPLGLDAFWRHAVFSATAAQSLCALLPPALKVRPGMAYLTGLLHNFGTLLLGHSLQEEFAKLNAAVAAHPDLPVTALERRLVGIIHPQIGHWLMRAWNMPEEVKVAVREHHNPAYRGEHAVYANLNLVVDRLLKSHGLGDGDDDTLPAALTAALGLDGGHAREVVAGLFDEAAHLDRMARGLAA